MKSCPIEPIIERNGGGITMERQARGDIVAAPDPRARRVARVRGVAYPRHLPAPRQEPLRHVRGVDARPGGTWSPGRRLQSFPAEEPTTELQGFQHGQPHNTLHPQQYVLRVLHDFLGARVDVRAPEARRQAHLRAHGPAGLSETPQTDGHRFTLRPRHRRGASILQYFYNRSVYIKLKLFFSKRSTYNSSPLEIFSVTT